MMFAPVNHSCLAINSIHLGERLLNYLEVWTVEDCGIEILYRAFLNRPNKNCLNRHCYFATYTGSSVV